MRIDPCQQRLNEDLKQSRADLRQQLATEPHREDTLTRVNQTGQGSRQEKDKLLKKEKRAAAATIMSHQTSKEEEKAIEVTTHLYVSPQFYSDHHQIACTIWI